MKQPLLTLVFLCVIFNCQAQWTTNGNNVYNSNTGNLGVGTSSPTAKLSVANGAVTAANQIYKALELSPASGAAHFANGSALYFDSQTNVGGRSVAGIWSSLWSGGSSGSDFSGAMVFGTKNEPDAEIVERMRITKDGSIGIGTSDTKGYKLAINGSAIATSIKVKETGNWPDFVFKKYYKLKSLSELKTFIDKNNHLPEIPSAIEVAKNGQDLGEMNKLLLKKVEELTLYLIDLDKKVKTQSIQIDKQSKQIAHLIKK